MFPCCCCHCCCCTFTLLLPQRCSQCCCCCRGVECLVDQTVKCGRNSQTAAAESSNSSEHTAKPLSIDCAVDCSKQQHHIGGYQDDHYASCACNASTPFGS